MAQLVVKACRLDWPHITLEIPDIALSSGDICVLYGESGSGTSEFCLLLAGLLPRMLRTLPAKPGRLTRTVAELDPSTLSSITLDGELLYQLSDADRAKKVGTVFADPGEYFIGRNVLEEYNYSFVATEQDLPEPQTLKPYGLYGNGLVSRPTDVLSGGERHRLNLACAIEQDQSLLVIDLSRSNLDTNFITDQISRLIETRQDRITIIYGLRPGEIDKSICKEFVVNDNKVKIKSLDNSQFPGLQAARQQFTQQYNTRPMRDILATFNGVHRPKITNPANFKLYKSELLQIRGPNGSGKTTLGKLIVGWLKKSNFSGTINSQSSKPFDAVMSLQNPDRMFLLDTTVATMVSPEIRSICAFSDYEQQLPPRALSYSRQKLLAAAVAIQCDADCAILDEPTSGMDHADRCRLISIINNYNDKTIIMFSHDESFDNIGRILEWEDITG